MQKYYNIKEKMLTVYTSLVSTNSNTVAKSVSYSLLDKRSVIHLLI